MTAAKKSALLILVVALAAGAGYYFYQKRAAAGPETRYKTEALGRGEVTQTVSANGTLNPVTLVSVGTQVSGTVKSLYVDFNDEVKEGQILAELDDSTLAAQVRQSDASVANAEAALTLARVSEKRMQELFRQEYVSRQELDQATATRASAEAQTNLARAQNDRDRANLRYSVIRSPVSGVVVDRQVDIGQTVAASFQTPTLFKIAQDMTEMQIYTTFAEADIGPIRVDQPVRFNVDAFPNRSFQGKVKQLRLNPTTQQNVVTYNVVVAVDNPEQILLPGMTAYVAITVAQKKDALLVPNTALRFKPPETEKSAEKSETAAPPAGGGSTNSAGSANSANSAGAAGAASAPGAAGNGPPAGGERRSKRDTGSGTVYVLDGKVIKPVKVRTGITDSRFTEVVSGELKEDDKVIVGENLPAAAAPESSSTFRMRLF
ncbi:MAG: efflux RND transporter periplasmic adaptor subunit [Zoogloeaceae bacterium]|jgi:HlyD family secretion protein|nr:efflux RND transporter periplasmic adaptor subunit [Zoogloeaceae bacterium]